ncbi:MAG: hypothetical protein ACM31C_08595, partial [Acidobacteriota bacterium]
MTRAAAWLLRVVGAVAAAALVFVVASAARAGAWLAVRELAALETTVVVALAVAATAIAARGRRAFALDGWPRAPGWRGVAGRIALVWCAALAAVLGVLPGLALDLGPACAWPPALVALAGLA